MSAFHLCFAPRRSKWRGWAEAGEVRPRNPTSQRMSSLRRHSHYRCLLPASWPSSASELPNYSLPTYLRLTCGHASGAKQLSLVPAAARAPKQRTPQ